MKRNGLSRFFSFRRSIFPKPDDQKSMPPTLNENAFIRAAGGLVWRDSPQGKRVAVVHRTRYGDEWTLPKGKLQDDESWLDAARREVREETGCQVRPEAFAGSIGYLVNDKPKVVRFWHMAVVDTTETPRDSEVDRVDWLTPQEAITRLKHPLEKALIESAQVEPPVKDGAEQGWRLFWKSTSYRRLQQSLQSYRIEVEYLIARQSPPSLGWSDALERLLDATEHALKVNDVELGWRCFKAAMRMELYGLDALADKSAYDAKARAIFGEANTKLSSWRKEAVANLLARDGKLNETIPVDQLVCAAQILHEHQDNEYQKLEVVKGQLLLLGCIVALVVLIWVAAVPALVPIGTDQLLVNSRESAFAIALFGVLGAAVSGILSTARDGSSKRIPEKLLDWPILVTRLAIGAGTALVVAVFLGAGLLNLGKLSPQLTLAAAFAAGFSERLVVRAVETVAK